MSRAGIDLSWQIMVRQLAENEPKLGARAITRRLELEGAKMGRGDWPSERSVGRILAAHTSASEEERRLYRVFYWPESQKAAGLPAEAAAAALELVAYLLKTAKARPTIRLIRWFWAVTTAAPDANVRDRLRAARCLSTWDFLGTLLQNARQVEVWLAFAPWRSEESAVAYREAAEQPFVGEVAIPVGPDLRRVQQALEVFAGVRLANADGSVSS